MLRLQSLLFLALILPSFAFSQSLKDMMEDSRENVYEVIDAAEDYFSSHARGKGSGWKGYNRWRAKMEPRFYPSGIRSNHSPRHLSKEYGELLGRETGHRATAAGENWRFMGPSYANNILPPAWASGLGRIEAVWAGAATPDTVYTGSRSGGFWKTTDGGSNWHSTTQDLAGVGVMDIAVHPERRNEVYIVTRHGSGYTLGILKSTDFGESWDTTGFSFAVNNYVRGRRLEIPVKDTFYCATSAGLYRSVDDGINWLRMRTGNIGQLVVHPGNSQKLYITDNNNNTVVLRSTDAGNTWISTTISGNSGSPRLAISAAQPDWVFMASNSGVWRSTDEGQSFVMRGSDPTNSGMMCFGVSDTDPDRLFAGSLNHYSSTDGGQTFTQFMDWVNPNGPNYIHADGRVLRAWKGVIYMGTDGFLGRSLDNGQNWSQVNAVGTGVREFYRIGCSPADIGVCNGGSQDNGTSVYLDGTWYEWIGADGMEAQVDRNDPDIWFGTIQFGNLQRTTSRGQDAIGIAPTTNGDWITPSVLDHCNDNTIFIAFDELYKSNDNGENWSMIYNGWNVGNMHELAIAPSDSNYLYITRSSRIWRSTDNGKNWLEVSNGLPNKWISRIAVSPDDPNSLVLTLSGFSSGEKVYRSDNGGFTWLNISGNLPNFAANCVVIEDSPDKRIFIGMDVGVYYRPLLSGNWTLYMDSLPAVEVTDIELLEGANLLRIGTWGRGMWEAPLPGRGEVPQVLRVEIFPKPSNTHPNTNDTVHVRAKIIDDGNVQSAILNWGLDGQTYPNSIAMNSTGNDTFMTVTTIPPQAINTNVYFKIIAFDDVGDSTKTEKFVYKTREAVLCAAIGATVTSFDFIDSVHFHTLNNVSQLEYYGDFRNIYTDISRDSTYALGIHMNYVFPQDSAFAWVDWNGNLNFTDPGEQVIMTALDANSMSSADITVPAYAILDTVTLRLRVIYGSNPVADPCDEYQGEVEDYSLVIRQDSVVGILETELKGPFTLDPNPTQGLIHLRMNTGGKGIQLNLMDLRGQRIQLPVEQKAGSVWEMDLGQLAAGIYFLEVRKKNSRWIRRIVVQR